MSLFLKNKSWLNKLQWKNAWLLQPWAEPSEAFIRINRMCSVMLCNPTLFCTANLILMFLAALATRLNRWQYLSVVPPLCSKHEYLKMNWMDCHYILNRHLWSPEDDSKQFQIKIHFLKYFGLWPDICKTNDFHFSLSWSLGLVLSG